MQYLVVENQENKNKETGKSSYNICIVPLAGGQCSGSPISVWQTIYAEGSDKAQCPFIADVILDVKQFNGKAGKSIQISVLKFENAKSLKI